MTDRYQNFEALSAEMQEGVDFRIRSQDRGTSVVVLAPHGGTIEPETAEIAEAIAGSALSFYAFEALKPGAHGDYHITSHRFDEPTALDLVGRSHTSVAIHGRRDGDDDAVWLGGRNTGLRDAIGAALREAGFDAMPNKRLPGVHQHNICNRTRTGEGVQLELSRSLRRALSEDQRLLTTFCRAVRTAIGSAQAQ